MCGIYGYFDRTGGTPDAQDLAAMDASLVHRGPDDSGVFTAPGAAVGNRRLSIIDIAGGHQPFVSDDGKIALVQNGEIFNHVELRAEAQRQGVRFATDHSDTEVLLRLYEREGLDFLPRLNGMFAIAIWDGRGAEAGPAAGPPQGGASPLGGQRSLGAPVLHLVRDRIGVKPLFVHDDGQRVLFGSEIKAVLAALPGRPTLDLSALQHYLAYNYVPPPFTLFAGIRHVMPGTVLTVSCAGSSVRRWWSLAEQTPAPQTFSAWQEEFLALLDDAVRLRLRADVPFGAFLSGGVDSSTVVALMARHVREPARTFCIGFPDPRFDESPYAQEAAQRFGATHRSAIVQPDLLDDWAKVLWHCDQPHGDASFMPTREVSRLAVGQLGGEGVKVVLTGDGGDELFAGYDKYASFMADPALRDLPAANFARHYVAHTGLFGEQARAALFQPWLRHKLAGVDSVRDVAAPWFEQAAHFDRVNQMLYLDMMLLLPGNNLVKPDRMGMSVSLEARTPFLDWRMMEFAFRAPGDTKLKDGDKKHWFKRAVEPLIGADLAHRKKQMFTVPIGEWFRGPRKQWLHTLLFAPNALGAQLFDMAQVRKLFDAHTSGAANHTRELRALAALELWAQQFEPRLPT